MHAAPFDPFWPRLALLATFCPVRPCLASFGPVWPRLARLILFGIIWHHFDPFGLDWPHLALIDHSSILISRYFKVPIRQGEWETCKLVQEALYLTYWLYSCPFLGIFFGRAEACAHMNGLFRLSLLLSVTFSLWDGFEKSVGYGNILEFSRTHLIRQRKMNSYGRGPMMEDALWWKKMLEDNLWWKTTFDERHLLMEADLWWKMTFDIGLPLIEDNLQMKTNYKQNLRLRSDIHHHCSHFYCYILELITQKLNERKQWKIFQYF